MYGWGTTATENTTWRSTSNYARVNGLPSSEFTMHPLAAGQIDSICVDIIRKDASLSVKRGRFALKWQQGGVTYSAWTSDFYLGSGTSWITHSASFTGGTPLPSGPSLGGKSFLFQFYCWDGGTSSTPGQIGIIVDNMVINGSVSCSGRDLGDHNFTGQTLAYQIASTDLRAGTNATDAESTNIANSGATADDTGGTDDEDVLMPSFAPGVTTSLVIPVTANLAALSGTTARIGVWVDWNGDNDVADTGETLAAQTITGTGNYTFSITPPAGTTLGTKYLRIRLTEGASAPAFAGGSTL